MTKLSTSVAALALAAIAVACPAHAMPKGGNLQVCYDRCDVNPGRNGSVEQCRALCRLSAGNNARATAAARRKPNPTPTHSGSRH